MKNKQLKNTKRVWGRGGVGIKTPKKLKKKKNQILITNIYINLSILYISDIAGTG